VTRRLDTLEAPPRLSSRLNLALPRNRFDTGLDPAELVVLPDHDFGAVVLAIPDADGLELVLSPHSAVTLVMRIGTVLRRLNLVERGDA
jgi:hypothetical protein